MNAASEWQRLIKVAFPLKQAPIDSVHKKTVRDGRISTLHNNMLPKEEGSMLIDNAIIFQAAEAE